MHLFSVKCRWKKLQKARDAAGNSMSAILRVNLKTFKVANWKEATETGVENEREVETERRRPARAEDARTEVVDLTLTAINQKAREERS